MMENKIENKLKICECLRCGHDWGSRLPLPPRFCPRCHSEAWSRAKRERVQSIAPPPKVPKYPFDTLEIGQSITVPWLMTEDGKNVDSRAMRSLNAAITWIQRRTGKRFYRAGMMGGPKHGLTVTRVK